MAVYSVAVGAQTGGGALLAASALAFGLLAANVDRGLRGSASTESRVTPGMQRSPGPNGGGPADPYREAVAQIEADPITDREREILSLVAEGNSNKKISAELRISERTVKNHLTATMTKLRASDRTHTVVTAVRLGWLDL